MDQFTQWDKGILGPDTYTSWDDVNGGPAETKWDMVAEFIGSSLRVVWQAVTEAARWASIADGVRWK